MPLLPLILAAALAAAGDAEWPSFRGPDAAGVAEGAAPATTWNVETGEGILWKTPIPGLAHSSPVITGDRLFVTTAARDGEATLKVGLYGAGDSVEDEGDHEFTLTCLDRATGAVRWTRTAMRGTPRVKRHPKSSHANSTPATDGRHVVAFFGSEGLHCFTVDGDRVWQKDLGLLDAGAPGMRSYQWGFASSPVIHEGRVIIQCDVQDQSFVAALDLATGEDVWRTDRDEDPTWSTPAVDVRSGRRQVICNGYRHIGGYDLDTGAALWWMHGGGDVPVPTPIVAHDLVFITSAHGRQAPIYAIRPDVTGEITDDPDDGHMAWSTRKSGNYMQTPLVYGDELYCCRDNGVLTCYDARTGEQHYRERLGSGRDGFSASAVAAGGVVYVTSEEGLIHVLRAGTTFETIAVNEMGETCMATPALAGGTLYVRTRGHVVAIGGATKSGDE
jgi:outer membrane protein assembly factor BamB